jgi:hypothetical protein
MPGLCQSSAPSWELKRDWPYATAGIRPQYNDHENFPDEAPNIPAGCNFSKKDLICAIMSHDRTGVCGLAAVGR